MDMHYSNFLGFLNAGLLRGISGFSLGVIVYRLTRSEHSILDIAKSPTVKFFIVKYVVLLEFLIVLASGFAVIGRSNFHSAYDFFAVIAFSCLIFIFSFERGPISKVFASLKSIGAWSYAIYLLHMPIYYLVRPIFDLVANVFASRDIAFVIYLAVLIFISRFAYLYIETPSKRYLKSALGR